MPYKHEDSKTCFFPLPLCYTRDEWDTIISDFLSNKSKTCINDFLPENISYDEQTIEKVLYDDNNWYVILWTQDFVFSIQSKFTESYNGNFDHIDVTGTPRNPVNKVVLPF